MPAVVHISEPLVREFVRQAVSNVFTTMIGQEPILRDDEVKASARQKASRETNQPQVVGSVGFAGESCGLIYLHFPLSFARACTAHLLGLTDAELLAVGDESVNDAVAELTNMTVGSFKNGLCDAGLPCTVTIPSILRGTQFVIEPTSSVVRFVYHFDCGSHRITADVFMRPMD